MGTHRPRPRLARRVQPLTAKPPADRLYGRVRGPTLRPRQQLLLDVTLPRLRFRLDQANSPITVFPPTLTGLALEIGSGGGEHALGQLDREPRTALIACEVYANGLCSLLSRLVPETADPATTPLPAHLRLWDDDARILLRALPPACLDALFLLFPDPWPKARHIKRRFVHPGQLPLVARVLKPGATWRIASDDPTYQAWVSETMAAQTQFLPSNPASVRPPGWPPTRYEAKALRAGRTPRYWSFVRSSTPPEGACAGWTPPPA